MIRIPALAAFALVLAACAEDSAPDAASASAWIVDHERSALNFHGEYGAVRFDGEFRRWDAEIVFAPDDLENSSIRAEIDVASIVSGDSGRDEAALSTRWLDALNFPSAYYESDDIRAAPVGYVAHGVLTIAGQSHPLDLAFDVSFLGNEAQAFATTEFDRHEIGLEGGYDDEDTGRIFGVEIDITATRVE